MPEWKIIGGFMALEIKSFMKDECFWKLNTLSTQIGVVLKGTVNIEVSLPKIEGFPSSLQLGKSRPASIIGETAILNVMQSESKLRTASIVANEDKTRILLWDIPDWPWPGEKKDHAMIGNFIIANVYFFAYRNLVAAIWGKHSIFSKKGFNGLIGEISSFWIFCQGRMKEYLSENNLEN